MFQFNIFNYGYMGFFKDYSYISRNLLSFSIFVSSDFNISVIMCTTPPPPPPPLLPCINSSAKLIKSKVSAVIYDADVCQWATRENPELRESCAKYNICHSIAPYKYNYRHFESILQIGPTCGLVALSMVVNADVSAEELLNISKLEGYTSNGEMFSCKNMVKLAEKTLCLAEINDVKCTLQKEGLFSSNTIEKLLSGAVLLVPYDADFNHSPCLRKGHTAHWAIVCGVMVIDEPVISYETNPENIYVFCKHGKSKYLAAWNLYELAQSNSNLWEFSPKKGADGLVYVLPDGGIGGENGLRDQFLIFEGL